MNDPHSDMIEPPVLSTLAAHADTAEHDPAWPAASVAALRGTAALTWAIPTTFGGQPVGLVEMMEGYADLGAACLVTAFLLSQRDAAVRRLVVSGHSRAAQELLPVLARGEAWATVGVSQLTTSRQHTRPAMRVERRAGGGIMLDGVMPWVSGAAHSDYLVTGGVTDEGQAVLAVVPAEAQGLVVGPPLDLLAVRGSCTAQVRCDRVELDARWVLEDRPDQVAAGDGAGGLTTSCLALALARAALDYLRQEAASRPDLTFIADRLARRHSELWQELIGHAATGAVPGPAAASLRAKATECALRTTQAALTAGKGTGFVRPHPAQRWARQALFFLVWSCPRPTAAALLDCFAPGE